MKFEQLQHRVQRAEQLVEGRTVQTLAQWRTLKQAWRDGWTPGRIVIAGLVTGFITGRSEPLRAMTGARWLQMVGSLSSLFASVQAATAAGQASEAADQAGDAADTAQAVQQEAAGAAYPEEPLIDEQYDDTPVVAPRPAEAATEVSER